jgi:hypothetical protein
LVASDSDSRSEFNAVRVPRNRSAGVVYFALPGLGALLRREVLMLVDARQVVQVTKRVPAGLVRLVSFHSVMDIGWNGGKVALHGLGELRRVLAEREVGRAVRRFAKGMVEVGGSPVQGPLEILDESGYVVQQVVRHLLRAQVRVVRSLNRSELRRKFAHYNLNATGHRPIMTLTMLVRASN